MLLDAPLSATTDRTGLCTVYACGYLVATAVRSARATILLNPISAKT